MKRRQMLHALLASAGVAAASSVRAQAQYPAQVIQWIVPNPAGGGTDNLARALADSMRTSLGQQIVVDNRPGAATNIGADHVARAKPDGYTIMSADNALMFLNEHLFRKLPFKPESDFTYIGGIGRFPLLLVVHPGFPVSSFAEFMARLRADPGKDSYASVGLGSPHHLAMELLKNRTGTSITHVPYKGAAPAMQDVMGGQVPVMFLDLASGLGAIQSGKLRPLAIGSPSRSPILPNVPTLAELGVEKAEVFAIQGVLGPAGLPAAIVARLNDELNKALADPAVLQRFSGFGFEPLRMRPDEFKALVRAESSRWGPVIRAANVTLD